MEQISDCHMHTKFSSDSVASMESMVERAIELGMTSICLTDHHDMDYETEEFRLDTPAYFEQVREVQNKYSDRIKVRFGVEIGLQPHLKERLKAYVDAWPFDYIIGSTHVVKGKDAYYPQNLLQWTDIRDLYRAYFRETVENIHSFHEFQTLGHLDYVVRYGKKMADGYSYEFFADEIDEILRLLIKYDIALEINTGGYRAGLGFPNPHPDVIRRYRELGGEMITFGADAHAPEHIGYAFDQAKELALSLGFRSYVRFVGRKCEFVKI